MQRDQIYSTEHDLVEEFRFDQSVANVFPDMIQRSVPGYGVIISLVGLLAEQYLQQGSYGYDLGSSLGASTLAMVGAAEEKRCRIIAVDSSSAMIKKCRENLATAGLDRSSVIDLRCEDVRDTKIENASFVTMNFTLQFIPVAEREDMLRRVADGISPGGGFMLSEKIGFDDSEQQKRMESLHHAFKRANGYSELEISQKRTALEDVLVPETLQHHFARLERAGFSRVEVLFQALNFVSMLAVR
ncbi:MAG: carboxy-S-adenosyl-L-methionine synthase CmoA [Gammaproteobacteria bacterium]|uniref:Carboxy-S-adenosyl-L-methionine synthase n=1 Tax=Candidatus Thiopontia autotrophica TaxID=2841688 RepID=A0A8J6P820_9GAMM|nr:carboxy-S-adenosyl-L-methionine synthase CmoA [Candidatus Thiopontia autotrophica]MBL6969237.1 carboxy-S-adenosyl-L-methionine synthase CmoA [Gammaproteobacteria bacterium]